MRLRLSRGVGPFGMSRTRISWTALWSILFSIRAAPDDGGFHVDRDLEVVLGGKLDGPEHPGRVVRESLDRILRGHQLLHGKVPLPRPGEVRTRTSCEGRA